MLHGIHPLLTGELLRHLDEMGHSDGVVVADAHFPATAIGARVLTLPGVSAPDLLAAIRTVIPPDDEPAVDLMASADGAVLPVQHELLHAAGTDAASSRFLDRVAFYDAAREAFVVVRTGETRAYGNAILRKGLVTG